MTIGVEAHRQPDVGMPHKLLSDGRQNTGRGKQRAEGPAEGMKLKPPFGLAPYLSHRLYILPESYPVLEDYMDPHM